MLAVYKTLSAFRADAIQPFGTGPNQTLMSLGTVSSVLAILSMATFTMVDIVTANAATSLRLSHNGCDLDDVADPDGL
jgi:hypothetical protein